MHHFSLVETWPIGSVYVRQQLRESINFPQVSLVAVCKDRYVFSLISA
jgi:hypothetical protein